MNIHCPRCASEFCDPRDEMHDGDEAICPRCGARHVFRDAAGDAAAAAPHLSQVNGRRRIRDKMP